MKKIFFLVVALFSVSTMMANATIPTVIDGIHLGYSTRSEVTKILTSNGLVLSEENSTSSGDYGRNEVYLGKYTHNGMEFQRVSVSFLDGTILNIGFYASCESECTDFAKPFLEEIHSKYNALASADTSLFVMGSTIGLKGYDIWSRKDDKTVVLTMHDDSTCLCFYHAESRMMEITTNYILEKALGSSPDYAEENKVYGVAGVKFGDSKETVKRVITPKSGMFLDDDGYCLTFTNTTIGGVTYEYTKFYFLPNKGLVSVSLQASFYSWREEEALMKYEGIKNQYSRKYTNFKTLTDDKEAKLCAGGAYIDGYDYLPITISFQKALSRGGEMRYYVLVDYYEYRKERIYDDEI